MCAFCDFDLCIYQIWYVYIKYINDKWIHVHITASKFFGKDKPGQVVATALPWFPIGHWLSDTRSEVVKPEPDFLVAGSRPHSYATKPLFLPCGRGWGQKMPILNISVDCSEPGLPLTWTRKTRQCFAEHWDAVSPNRPRVKSALRQEPLFFSYALWCMWFSVLE